MLKHFEKAAQRHTEIKKEAFLGAGLKVLGKFIKKNPGKAAMGGLTAATVPMDVADASRRVSQAKGLGRAQGNLSRTFSVGPTY